MATINSNQKFEDEATSLKREHKKMGRQISVSTVSLLFLCKFYERRGNENN